MAEKKSLSCGRELFCVPNLTIALTVGGENGLVVERKRLSYEHSLVLLQYVTLYSFDFMTIPLVHPRYMCDYLSSDGVDCGRNEPFSRSDLIMSSSGGHCS